MTDHSTQPDATPRSVAAVDVPVLDSPTMTVSDLFADAAGITTSAANTVSELFTAQADAIAAAATAALADTTAPVALVQGAAALVDAAGTLRFLAEHVGPAHPPTRERWQQLAAELTRDAGALMLTRDQQASRHGDGDPPPA